MAESDNGSKDKDAAGTGEKHQTEHESPDSKRPRKEAQTTLDDSLEKNDDKNDDKNGDQGEDSAADVEERVEDGGASAVKPSEEPDVPSNLLEKGIIYFFIRGRVGIDKPSEVDEIARSYVLLRPIENDAKLGEGPIGDAGNTRLLALPKKVLPLRGKDRFMVFVEKSAASFDEIKKSFLDASDYETKTVGTRHSPAATPVGEGVYAITTTGRESHLAYMLTLPEKLDTVQEELGLKGKGSFIISTKNPSYAGPANSQLPRGPDYPEEIIDEFRKLRWLPSKPAHFDYVNAQILLIGESGGLEKAVHPSHKSQENGKEELLVVMEHLEDEDLKRMRHLPGEESASIFADLQVLAKDYPKILTTF